MTYALRLVRSTAFAIIFYIGTVPFVISAGIASLLGAAGLLQIVTGWSRFHRLCCRWLLGQRIRIEGKIPSGPMLIVMKHESMFETIDLVSLFRYPAVVAKLELARIPLWGPAAEHYGLIAVDRDDGARALRKMQREAKAYFDVGRSVAIFPEGTRVPHGQRVPLFAGFAALYKLLNVAVLPIAVDSGRISPRKTFVKRPGTITYKIGEIIPPGLPREEAEQRAFEAINALNPPTGDGLSHSA